MRKIISLVLILLTALSLCSCQRCSINAEYAELGVPLENYYGDGIERNVWDIEYFDDMLFIGSGDYDKNKGPVQMYSYDLKEEKWEATELLPDEQIERFFVFDSKLYAAGCDPKGDWDYGNFYAFENGKWKTYNTIPGGIHNFDMIKFEGKIFAGLGVAEGNAPIVCTEDRKEWQPIYLYKDGKLCETDKSEHIRVYDFFTLDDTLYAYFYVNDQKEIYRLDGDKFVYHSDMLSNVNFRANTYNHICQKAEFKGKQYFSTGLLYKTDDMKKAENIELGDNVTVTDIKVINNTLYLLCNKKIVTDDKNEEFRVSVMKSRNGKRFTEIFYFSYPVGALCFTYSNHHFYFGMGYGISAQKEYAENGMVLSVEKTAS